MNTLMTRRPLKVGDRVGAPDGHVGTVHQLRGGYAAVTIAYGTTTRTTSYPITTLVRLTVM